jgi:probable HAF family extracellular repeat protein
MGTFWDEWSQWCNRLLPTKRQWPVCCFSGTGKSGGEKMATKEFLSATKPLARSSAVVAVVVAVGVALAVGVLCQQPGAQAQDATVAPTYTVKDLGTLGGPSSSAFGINDAGQVVGWASTSHGGSHAFLYDRKATPKMQDLGTLGGNFSLASDINDAGQVVGSSDTTNCSVAGCVRDYHAFLYERSATPKMQDLGTLGVGTQSPINTSVANSINDAGQVVGGASTSSDPDYHAFLYERSATPEMQDLGTLGDDDYSEARGINDAGQVVGVSAPASSSNFYHAFLYERSATPEMQDLNSLIRPHSGWSLEEARAINQRGQIVGLGERNGHTRAILLTPRKKTL